MPFTAAVITVSDSSSEGKREDLSGPALVAELTKRGYNMIATQVVRDDQPDIELVIMEMCDKANLVVTTGGTGIAARDVTPEATRSVADRIVEGVAERMRAAGLKHTPLAVLSRGVCAVRGRSLILNVPGKPAAALDSLTAVIDDVVPHALELLAGKTEHR